MIRMCRKCLNGIDLNDSNVQEMLARLQDEKVASTKEAVKNPIKTLVDSMSREKLMQLLGAEGIDQVDKMTMEELKDLAREIISQKEQPINPKIWIIGCVLLIAWIAYRVLQVQPRYYYD